MIRTAFFIAAGVLAAACCACAPPPPEAIGAAPPTPAAVTVLPQAIPVIAAAQGPAPPGVCDPNAPHAAQSFIAAVKLLAPGYLPPAGPHSPYAPPTGISYPWSQLSPAIATDLTNAFEAAPPWFRQHLCQLQGIFINTSMCQSNDPNQCNPDSGAEGVFTGSWGFRSRDASDLGYTYVAIPGNLWRAGGAGLALHDYETRVLRSFPGSASVTVYGASPDFSSMSVLAALAHEVGHVQWVKTVKPLGRRYDFTSLMTCLTGDFFVGWAYDHRPTGHPHLQPRNSWRPFRNRENEAGAPLEHLTYPKLAELETTAPDSFYPLFELYQPGEPWASLFGAQTPDEDYVETYVMSVLTGFEAGSHPYEYLFYGPLTSMPLRIPGYAPRLTEQRADVAYDVSHGRKGGLAAKMWCIQHPGANPI